MKNVYLLYFKEKSGYHAGFKAREDIKEICLKNKFKIISFMLWVDDKTIFKRFLRLLCYFISLIRLLFFLKKGDVLIVQYPQFTYVLEFFFHALFPKKRFCVIAMIHDVESLRENGFISGKEIENLNKYNYIIAHNEKMKMELNDKNVGCKVFVIDLFDYILNDDVIEFVNNNIKMEYDSNNTIAIAGNLDPRKTGYLYKINESSINSLEFYLFGVLFNEHKMNIPRYKYKGVFDPNIPKLNAKWGLIWDGNSTNTCNGMFGEYLKFNNPHKVSLYLAMGIPVIIWNKSALSDFVLKNNLGITISSLDDLEKEIKFIDPKKYIEIKNNVSVLSNKIQKGYFFNKVINDILYEI